MPWTLSSFADEAGGTLDEQITASARDGLRFIDLRNVDGHNIAELPLELAEAAAAKLRNAGIAVQMFGSPIGKTDIADDLAIDLAKLDHLGQLKDVFGCNAVRIFSFYNQAKATQTQWESESLDRLLALRDRAGELGMVLYHENESDIFGDHPDDVAMIADALRDPAVFRMIYDFANYLRTGVSGLESWETMKDATDCFHFKDQNAAGEHLPMGQGDTDVRAILSEAKARGWSGPCTVEPHLTHSDAVLATHASGTGTASLKDMPPAETFHTAVVAVQELLTGLGIAYA